jgi:hypothetical protein
MLVFASRRVTDDNKATFQRSIADDALLSVVLADVLNLNGGASKDQRGVLNVGLPRSMRRDFKEI